MKLMHACLGSGENRFVASAEISSAVLPASPSFSVLLFEVRMAFESGPAAASESARFLVKTDEDVLHLLENAVPQNTRKSTDMWVGILASLSPCTREKSRGQRRRRGSSAWPEAKRPWRRNPECAAVNKLSPKKWAILLHTIALLFFEKRSILPSTEGNTREYCPTVIVCDQMGLDSKDFIISGVNWDNILYFLHYFTSKRLRIFLSPQFERKKGTKTPKRSGLEPKAIRSRIFGLSTWAICELTIAGGKKSIKPFRTGRPRTTCARICSARYTETRCFRLALFE